MYFLTYTDGFVEKQHKKPGDGREAGKSSPSLGVGRRTSLRAATDRIGIYLTTLSGGSLGSGVDEERSQLRELM